MSDTPPPRYPTVHVRVPADDADVAGSLLFDAGATGLEERDDTTLDRGEAGLTLLVAHFDTDAEAQAAVDELSGRWTASLEHVVGDDWREGWKRFFKPTRVGRRLVVRPSWEPFEAGPDDVVIVIDPDQAFGTGTHETTQLVLEEIDARVRGGERVLDVGCGSGILAIAALKLGAARAFGVDIDPTAARIANENASLNEAHLIAIPGEIGDATDRYELVLANIRGPILVPLAGAIAERVRDGGLLVLSGLLLEEESDVRAAYDPHLRYVSRRAAGDWLALTYERPAP